jgi:MFS family permease
VSLSLVSLTITVYMIVQGLAPSFWGPLSDTKGRRITFIGKFRVLSLMCQVLTCLQVLSLFILQQI